MMRATQDFLRNGIVKLQKECFRAQIWRRFGCVTDLKDRDTGHQGSEFHWLYSISLSVLSHDWIYLNYNPLIIIPWWGTKREGASVIDVGDQLQLMEDDQRKYWTTMKMEVKRFHFLELCRWSFQIFMGIPDWISGAGVCFGLEQELMLQNLITQQDRNWMFGKQRLFWAERRLH